MLLLQENKDAGDDASLRAHSPPRRVSWALSRARTEWSAARCPPWGAPAPPLAPGSRRTPSQGSPAPPPPAASAPSPRPRRICGWVSRTRGRWSWPGPRPSPTWSPMSPGRPGTRLRHPAPFPFLSRETVLDLNLRCSTPTSLGLFLKNKSWFIPVILSETRTRLPHGSPESLPGTGRCITWSVFFPRSHTTAAAELLTRLSRADVTLGTVARHVPWMIILETWWGKTFTTTIPYIIVFLFFLSHNSHSGINNW